MNGEESMAKGGMQPVWINSRGVHFLFRILYLSARNE